MLAYGRDLAGDRIKRARKSASGQIVDRQKIRRQRTAIVEKRIETFGKALLVATQATNRSKRRSQVEIDVRPHVTQGRSKTGWQHIRGDSRIELSDQTGRMQNCIVVR